MLEQFKNRSDADVYAHPEIKETYIMANEAPNLLDTVYNENTPYEERQADVQGNYKMFKEIMPFPKGTQEIEAPGCPEEPGTPVTFNIIWPKKMDDVKNLPCLFVIPGGALYQSMDMACPIDRYAKEYKAAVVVMRYRTYFDENGTYPAAINDLHAVYAYINDHAEELRIDKEKIVIAGMSSGGHLSLALCHRLKKYGYRPRGCQVIGAIADDRKIYPSTNVTGVAWDGEEMYYSSHAWLGELADSDNIPAEAFANHATAEECIGLPPTAMHIFDADPSVDSNMAYASKLIEAGVCTQLHVWGGCNHEGLIQAYLTEMFEDDATYPQRFIRTVDEEIKEFFKNDLRR